MSDALKNKAPLTYRQQIARDRMAEAEAAGREVIPKKPAHPYRSHKDLKKKP